MAAVALASLASLVSPVSLDEAALTLELEAAAAAITVAAELVELVELVDETVLLSVVPVDATPFCCAAA